MRIFVIIILILALLLSLQMLAYAQTSSVNVSVNVLNAKDGTLEEQLFDIKENLPETPKLLEGNSCYHVYDADTNTYIIQC